MTVTQVELGPAGPVVAGAVVTGTVAGEEVPGADETVTVVKSDASHLVQIVEMDVVYTVEIKGVVRTSVVLPLVTVWPTGQVVT